MADRKKLDLQLAATTMFAFSMCKMLVEKGLITQTEASRVMVETAEMLREATDGEADGRQAESVARIFEQFASWLQGNPGNSPQG